MAQLLILVLDKEDAIRDVLKAWKKAGAPGMTMLESTGPGRLVSMLRDDLPLIPTLSDLLVNEEAHHHTLFTVLPDEDTAQRVAAATIEAVGDLSQPHTGVMFTLPIGQAWGLHKVGKKR